MTNIDQFIRPRSHRDDIWGQAQLEVQMNLLSLERQQIFESLIMFKVDFWMFEDDVWGTDGSYRVINLFLPW